MSPQHIVLLILTILQTFTTAITLVTISSNPRYKNASLPTLGGYAIGLTISLAIYWWIALTI